MNIFKRNNFFVEKVNAFNLLEKGEGTHGMRKGWRFLLFSFRKDCEGRRDWFLSPPLLLSLTMSFLIRPMSRRMAIVLRRPMSPRRLVRPARGFLPGQ
jgi:hypothetical protein